MNSSTRSDNYSPIAGHDKVEFVSPFGQLALGTFLPCCFKHLMIEFLHPPFLVLLTTLLEQPRPSMCDNCKEMRHGRDKEFACSNDVGGKMETERSPGFQP